MTSSRCGVELQVIRRRGLIGVDHLIEVLLEISLFLRQPLIVVVDVFVVGALFAFHLHLGDHTGFRFGVSTAIPFVVTLLRLLVTTLTGEKNGFRGTNNGRPADLLLFDLLLLFLANLPQLILAHALPSVGNDTVRSELTDGLIGILGEEVAGDHVGHFGVVVVVLLSLLACLAFLSFAKLKEEEGGERNQR